MTIELITKREYNKLLHRQQKYAKLTFNNVGYQYVDKSKFFEEDTKAFNEVTEILRKSIKGFVEFNNFLIVNDIIRVRFQYHYDASFTEVRYLELEELYKGFKTLK